MNKQISLVLLTLCGLLQSTIVKPIKALTGEPWTDPTTGETVESFEIDPGEPALPQITNHLKANNVRIDLTELGKTEKLGPSDKLTKDTVLQVYESPEPLDPTVEYHLSPSVRPCTLVPRRYSLFMLLPRIL